MTIFVVGPTASGKSGLAMELARRLNGEIVCADSQTLRKHLDIGTAKPSTQDQAEVPHWGLDLVQPGEPFTAADFKKYALKKIEVHQILKKDGKQTLMDFYYDETQMNKWRDSCKRTEESLKGKVDKFDKDIAAFKTK